MPKRVPTILAVLGLASVGVVLPTVHVEARPAPVKPKVVRLAVPTVPVAQRRSVGSSTTNAPGAVSVGGKRIVASLSSTGTSFDVAGVSFDGPAPQDMTVQARTRSASGWSAWLDLSVDGDGGPDAGSADARGARPGTE